MHVASVQPFASPLTCGHLGRGALEEASARDFIVYCAFSKLWELWWLRGCWAAIRVCIVWVWRERGWQREFPIFRASSALLH